MNKNDIKLIIIILIITILLMLILFRNESNNKAYVYYENKQIKEIDLNYDSTYEIDGYLGKMVIEVKNKKIRVKEETSPLHLCSLQGFVDNSYTPIICLPNKVIIKIEGKSAIDGVVY